MNNLTENTKRVQRYTTRVLGEHTHIGYTTSIIIGHVGGTYTPYLLFTQGRSVHRSDVDLILVM